MIDDMREFVKSYYKSKVDFDFVEADYYDIFVRNDMPKKQELNFIRESRIYLEAQGFDVYTGEAEYNYNHKRNKVQSNQILVAIKRNQ